MGKKKRRKQQQRYLIAVIFAMVFFGLILGWGQRYFTLSRVDEEILRCEQALTAAKKEQKQLENEKELLYDEDYLVILAREKLGYIRPGEKIWLKATVNEDVLPSVATTGIIEE